MCAHTGQFRVVIYTHLIIKMLLQTTECDQLYLAAKNGDVATIETLINKKYIDINAILPQRIDYQVTIIFFELLRLTLIFTCCIILY